VAREVAWLEAHIAFTIRFTELKTLELLPHGLAASICVATRACRSARRGDSWWTRKPRRVDCHSGTGNDREEKGLDVDDLRPAE
jgi:hypothetical protein